jgi:RNA polymerase sigma-70 factor (ECF subfamily)
VKPALVVKRRDPTPATPVASDDELVERMAVGDRDALGALFDRHQRALHSFLARASGAADPEIDDLVQTTFLEAFRAARRFRGRSSPRTWLFAIGGNVARMHRRASRRSALAISRLASQPEHPGSALDARIGDQRLLALVAAAIDELPHDLRVAYVMCVIEDVAVEDAARALGTARGTIWRRIHEARVALRAAADPGAGGGSP